jgi:uncharacterized NAD-dependent epimerase/dehydratase family protein
VILQHAPGRACFRGRERWRLPPIDEEIALIRLYGSEVIAIALNGESISAGALVEAQQELASRLGLPVVRPLEEGGKALLPAVRPLLR